MNDEAIVCLMLGQYSQQCTGNMSENDCRLLVFVSIIANKSINVDKRLSAAFLD